jgi:colanic acid/amylovoran biosynthesis glycosyltransferase
MTDPIRLAYLVSEYPAVSHTFILREIQQLRARDFDLKIASINQPARARDRMTEAERAEAAQTFYVKSAGVGAIARAHLATIKRSPLSYLRGLGFALRLGGLDLKRILFMFFYFVEAVILGDWMERDRRDHIHVHFANAASTVALIASRIFPLSFSLTVHGPDEFYEVANFLLKEKIVAARFICCIGHFARSQLMRCAPPAAWDKLVVAPLGVNPEIFAASEVRPAPECFEILCVGRLVPAKGQHVLLAACADLLRDGAKLRLRFVGDGPDRASLGRAATAAGLTDQIIFAGAVNQDEVRAFYRAADLFVLASFAEGIPVVLMEAMAMGIPCVSTFVAGIPELIRHEIDGILMMPSDREALKVAIAHLMRDADLRRRLGAAGRQRVLEQYDLDRNVARLAQIFAQRLGARPDPR